MENEVMFIKLDDIIPNRFQPREVFEEEALNKLADSIRRHGVIEPILVRPVSNKYEIVAGERRYKASVLAGLTKIPAIVKQMDDKESSIVAYIENEHRSDVSAIEEARTIDRILKNNNMTQEELAKEIGINQSTLANKLRLLSLPMEIQNALIHNEISERHARSLLSVKDDAKKLELLNQIKEKRMTVRELDSEIKSMNDNTINNNEYMNSSMPISEPYVSNSESPANNEFLNYLNTSDNDVADNYTNTPSNLEPNTGFMDFLNSYDNNNPIDNYTNPSQNMESNDYLNTLNSSPMDDYANEPSQNSEYMDYLNTPGNNSVDNYTNDTQVSSVDDDPSFMNFLNNYDNNNPLPANEPILDNNLNNYSEPTSFSESINDLNMPEENNNIYLNNNYELPIDNNIVINDVVPPITTDFNNNSYVENNPNFVDVSQNVVISNVDEIINKLKVVVDDIKATSKFKIDTDEINYDDIYQITIKIDKRDF